MSNFLTRINENAPATKKDNFFLSLVLNGTLSKEDALKHMSTLKMAPKMGLVKCIDCGETDCNGKCDATSCMCEGRCGVDCNSNGLLAAMSRAKRAHPDWYAVENFCGTCEKLVCWCRFSEK